METLIDGYRRFRSEVWPAERARYEALATWGQRPQTLVVACSDSRVDPATVFGAVPGELFVIRNVAGLVPVYQPDSGYHGTSAALEYGVRVLKVARIVVLGHAQCGGVRAMVEGTPPEARDFVAPWIAMAADALQAIPEHIAPSERLDYCENQVVRLSLANLMTFPWIAEAVAAGTLALHGFRFDIHTGVLICLDDQATIDV
jgi:carbonic anhydrase